MRSLYTCAQLISFTHNLLTISSVDFRTRRDILIVTGDFNAKIGNDNTGREKIMGREGLGTMNDNGEMFADFCMFNDLVIGGSVFQRKDIHKGTWVSLDHRTVNQIDHITIDKKFRRSLQDTRVRRGADAASDHHLLVGQVRLKLKKCLPPGSKAGGKFNTIYLKDSALKSTFKLTLSNHFQALKTARTTQWRPCGSRQNKRGSQHVKKYLGREAGPKRSG